VDPALIRALPMFHGFERLDHDALSMLFHERTWDDGEVIIEQGAMGGGVYMVLTGEIQVDRLHPGGAVVPMLRVMPGTLFGVLSVLDGGGRGARCTAVGPTTCGVMARHDFLELMEQRTPFALRFQLVVVRTLFKDLRLANRRLAELAALPRAEGLV